MGGATYKQNTFDVTGTAEPVCGIINDAGTKYSSFAYWGWGPENVYFDAENIGTSINELPGKVEEFSLAQNYPNPFNPTTNIEYSIAEAGLVELKIYNILGEEMTTLVNQFQNASKYRIDFNAANLSSGIYFYRITSGKFTDVKKMILIK
ncbi:T9SS type A sorting domain-containing protein [Candidatus Peregrinibacteria bacterium]|nr:T9SS type A sorting domain-containing protein [Candidatus Peregrinibacteria bacterium]